MQVAGENIPAMLAYPCWASSGRTLVAEPVCVMTVDVAAAQVRDWPDEYLCRRQAEG